MTPRPAACVALLGAWALAGCSLLYDWGAEIGGGADAAPRPADAAAPAADAACSGAGCATPDAGVSAAGCADGEREGFVDLAAQPDVAGCAGGFTEPGLRIAAAPACGRGAGDDGINPDGVGCNASDLCAAGWQVCASAAAVAAASASGTCEGLVPDDVPLFFATRQSGPGGAECGDGANDLFGCGTLGAAPAASCAPLDRFSNDLCVDLGAPWSCGADGLAEADTVTKPGPTAGGVLCCRD